MVEARVERRLAAILAADIAGYSRLMGVDVLHSRRAGANLSIPRSPNTAAASSRLRATVPWSNLQARSMPSIAPWKSSAAWPSAAPPYPKIAASNFA
jgi:hypothetical protein